jgi:predicted nucleic acid-binding protein
VIVVDSNVVAYCWINGPLTELAQSVRVQDPDWHIPLLWRSEMRSILTGYLRNRSLMRGQVDLIIHAAEAALAGAEHLVPSRLVFDVVSDSALSAYDGEFVALARALDVSLVTTDKAILEALPRAAMSMKTFLAGARAPDW